MAWLYLLLSNVTDVPVVPAVSSMPWVTEKSPASSPATWFASPQFILHSTARGIFSKQTIASHSPAYNSLMAEEETPNAWQWPQDLRDLAPTQPSVLISTSLLCAGFLECPTSRLCQAFDLLFRHPARLFFLLSTWLEAFRCHLLSEAFAEDLSLGRERDDEAPSISLKRVVSSLQIRLPKEGTLIGNQGELNADSPDMSKGAYSGYKCSGR